MLGVVLKRALRARSFHAFDVRHEEVSLGGGSGQSQEHGSCHSAQGKTLSLFFFFFLQVLSCSYIHLSAECASRESLLIYRRIKGISSLSPYTN